MKDPTLTIEEKAPGTIALSGALDLQQVSRHRRRLKTLSKATAIDLGGLTRLDTAGALILAGWAQKGVALQRLSTDHQALYELVANTKTPTIKKQQRRSAPVALLIHLGRSTIAALAICKELVTFLGRSAIAIAEIAREPKRLRMGEIVHHIEHIGINAIPIIALVAFLISVVLAYQSIEQLRPLGAQKFTVDLITISVLREMGVLLTAIMVAGRTGSAFTAEIGVMKIREEVDALKAIGVEPFDLLVVPRLIAIMVAVPILVFISNVMGLIGGAVLAKTLISMPFDQYVERVHHIAANGHALFVGMVKAPVFAFFIGIVGCMHGMKVSGSSESVGTETTSAVVQSIFLVLVLDAFFSIFFQKVGI